MNIINEFFVSFILIKLYFKFKVCRKIKFPLLWKFYFSKWKFYFSADKNPILSLLNASDCMQEAYIKVLLELMQRAKKDTKTKEVLEQIFKNKVDKYENLLTQSLNTNKDLQDFIDSLAKEDLIDSRAKFKL